MDECMGLLTLSFFAFKGEKIVNHWLPVSPQPLASWSEETAFGRELADEMLNKCNAEIVGLLLPFIVESMGRIGGIEIGFLTRIGERAGR